MLKYLIVIVALFAFTPSVDAGPLRNWAQARRNGERPVACAARRVMLYPFKVAKAARERRVARRQVRSSGCSQVARPQAVSQQVQCANGQCSAR